MGSRGEALRVVIARLAFPTMAQRAAKGRTRARQTTAGVTANANARSFLLRQKGATTLCFTMATAPRVGSVATHVRRLSKTARRNAAAPLHADTSRIRNPVRKKLQEQTVRCIPLPANAKMIIITQSTTRTASTIECRQTALRVAIAQLAKSTMGRRAANKSCMNYFTMATAPRVGSVVQVTRASRPSKPAQRNAASTLNADTSHIGNPVVEEQTVRCIALPANAKMIMPTQITTRTASSVEPKKCYPRPGV